MAEARLNRKAPDYADAADLNPGSPGLDFIALGPRLTLAEPLLRHDFVENIHE